MSERIGDWIEVILWLIFIVALLTSAREDSRILTWRREMSWFPFVTQRQLRGEFMALKDELKQETAKEKVEVDEALAARDQSIADLNARITDLEGKVMTADDIKEIKDSIDNIYNKPVDKPAVE